MPLAANAARNWVTSASVSTGSRHWFGVFVNTWIAVAPIATPRAGARATPPAVETWAPSRSVRASLGQPGRVALDDDQLLRPEIADRDHEPSTGSELLGEWCWHRGRRGGHDHPVERRALGPATRAVPEPGLDVSQIEPAEPLFRFDEEVGEALDRGDAGPQVGENRGLITGSGADLEHAVAAPRRERFGHERHDQRLGDRLAAANRQRRVLIRVGGEMGRQEPFARHPRHRREHPAIANPAARELAGNHAATRASRLRRGTAHLPPSAVAVP